LPSTNGSLPTVLKDSGPGLNFGYLAQWAGVEPVTASIIDAVTGFHRKRLF
jgi:hypothetical protein